MSLRRRGQPEGPKQAVFHELPLVLFTALAIAGSGVGTTSLGLALFRWVPWVPARGVMALIAVFLAGGLLFSFGHLGRPFRGPFALYRIGRSPLSNEVVTVGAAAAASLLSLALPSGHPFGAPLSLMALVSSFLTLLVLSMVYRLPGQLTWTGSTLIHPLVLGVAFGLTLQLGRLPEGTQARGELLVLGILLIDGILVWDRSRRVGSALHLGVPVHARIMKERIASSVLRTLLGVLLPAIALLSGWRELAGIALFLNLFLDRFLFYGLAVRDNIEAEIMKTEAALRTRVGSGVGDLPPTPTFIRAHER